MAGPLGKPRYVAIDAARGLALVYMVMWHTLHWMAPGSELSRVPWSADWLWGLVFKPAPTLFIMCFGCMLGALVIGRTRTLAEECRHMWGRALLVLVCYKALFWLEMVVNRTPPGEIVRGLLWGRLSGCVEIMDFYFFSLMLAPFVFWIWRRTHVVHKLAAIAGLWWLSAQWQATLWPETLAIPQALLVGRPGYYPFPLLPWGGTVLLGLLVGEHWRALTAHGRWAVVKVCLAIAAVLILFYVGVNWNLTMAQFTEYVVFLGWKHPPRVSYVAMSTGYAFALLALFVAWMGAERRPPGLTPLEVMGRHPLTLYNFHWLVLLGVGVGALKAYRTFPVAHGYLLGITLTALCLGLAYLSDLLPALRSGEHLGSRSEEPLNSSRKEPC